MNAALSSNDVHGHCKKRSIKKSLLTGTTVGVLTSLCMSFISPFFNILKLSRPDGVSYTISSDLLFYQFVFPYHVASNLLIGIIVGLATTCLCVILIRVPHSLLGVPAIAFSCGVISAFAFSHEEVVSQLSIEIFGVLYSFTNAFFVGCAVSIQVAVWFYSQFQNSLRLTKPAMHDSAATSTACEEGICQD